MVLNIIFTILIVYIFISLLFLPIQFRLLVALKAEEEKNRKKGEMNVGGLALSQNVRLTPLFFLANILASFMYRTKYKKK